MNRVPRDGVEAEGRSAFDPAASAGLFMGVSSFEDQRIHTVPFAVDDAVDLAHLFALELGLVLPEHLVLLLAGEPRKPGSIERLAQLSERGARRENARVTDFYRYLGKLTRETEEQGLFVLTVATHGISDQGGDFLLATDSLMERTLRIGISVSEVFDDVGRSGASRRLVLLDACRERLTHGTRSMAGSPMTQGFASAIADAKGSVVLSGATLGGFAYDDEERQNGVFTAAVLDGLRGSAKPSPDGWITVRTLADFVQQRVSTWVRRNQPNHAAKALGIERRFEATVEAMPLALHPEAMRKRRPYRVRREAALVRIKENQGKILTGALWDEIVALLPEDGPGPEAEQLFEEIEALDGTERSQRSLRDFLRELSGGASRPRTEKERTKELSDPIRTRVKEERGPNLVPLNPPSLVDKPRKEAATLPSSSNTRPLRPESVSEKTIERTLEQARRSDHPEKSVSRIIDQQSEARIDKESGPSLPSLNPPSSEDGPRKESVAHYSSSIDKPLRPESAFGKAITKALEGERRSGRPEKSMSRILYRHSETIYAMFRFVAGLLFMLHGVQKIFGTFGGQTPAAGSLIWIAGYIELIGGSLIMIGLFTSWAAFLASGTMAVAYFVAHFKPEAFWPIGNQGELAALYAFVFLCISAQGSGPFSMARARQSREDSISRIFSRYAEAMYALFRIVVGLLFSCHGMQKLFGLFGAQAQPPVGSLPWVAGVIELVCGPLVMIGLLASWAAFLASGTMAAAYFMAHSPQGFWPIMNHGELATLYCFAFLYIAARGAGLWGVARALKNPALE